MNKEANYMEQEYTVVHEPGIENNVPEHTERHLFCEHDIWTRAVSTGQVKTRVSARVDMDGFMIKTVSRWDLRTIK